MGDPRNMSQRLETAEWELRELQKNMQSNLANFNMQVKLQEEQIKKAEENMSVAIMQFTTVSSELRGSTEEDKKKIQKLDEAMETANKELIKAQEKLEEIKRAKADYEQNIKVKEKEVSDIHKELSSQQKQQ